MNKQRRFILLSSVAGIISVFLPWIDTPFVNYNGFNIFGVSILLCFIASGIISVIGDKTLHLDKQPWIFTFIAGCISILIIAAFFISKMNSLLNIMSVFSYGFFIGLLASIGVITSTYIFRSPDSDDTEQEIKSNLHL